LRASSRGLQALRASSRGLQLLRNFVCALHFWQPAPPPFTAT
jgi:hypothetical protein